MTKNAKKKKSRLPLVLLTIIALLIVGLIAMLYLMPEEEIPAEDAFVAATDPQATAVEEQKTDEPVTGGETEAPAQQEAAATEETRYEVVESGDNVSQLPYVLSEGLQINAIGKYAGIYMEDGTDEVVSDLLMIELENTSEEDLHLAHIKLHYGDVTAQFQVTNLPAHRKVILLEQNRMAYIAAAPDHAEAENVAYVEKFSMYEDQLQIIALDGVINVRNISGADIDEDIFVYYKNTAGDVYYGGITYRVRIEGGLKKDEVRQLMASHFDQDTCQLLMVTIGR